IGGKAKRDFRMSLDLYNSGEYVGPVASNAGWSHIVDAVTDPGSHAAYLLAHGLSDYPDRASEELEAWLKKTDASPEIESTVKNLVKLLLKVDGQAVISDGVGHDFPEEDAAKLRRTRIVPRKGKASKRATGGPKPVIYSHRLFPDSLLAQKALAGALTDSFEAMRIKVTKALAAALDLPHLHLSKATAETQAEKDAMESLREEFLKIAEAAEGPLTHAAVAGAKNGALQLEISDKGMLARVNVLARDWAGQRAAELAGMKKLRDGT